MLWAYTLAQVLFITAFNVAIQFKEWTFTLRGVILGIQYFLLNFVGFFCVNYIESNRLDLVSLIMCFSPTV